MDKRFLSILAALVIIFGGIFVVSQKSNEKTSGDSGDASKVTNHVEGEGQKNVTLLEYGDFQCPVCKSYHQPIKDAVAQYSKDVKFQFRHLPLTSIHPNAFAAHRAAEAAGLQNKFWEMHDKIYENQDPTGKTGWVASNSPLNFFTTYAEEIGLNMEQFKKDYPSAKTNDAINADLSAFGKTGQKMSTPTFFLNGKYIENSRLADPSTGSPTAASIGKLLAEAIAEASKK